MRSINGLLLALSLILLLLCAGGALAVYRDMKDYPNTNCVKVKGYHLLKGEGCVRCPDGNVYCGRANE